MDFEHETRSNLSALGVPAPSVGRDCDVVAHQEINQNQALNDAEHADASVVHFSFGSAGKVASRTPMKLPTSLHITKLAAAERQVKAGIRMFFAREDSLAVHTVAAAGYQLLVDLKAKRGMNEAADVHLSSIFYAVRSFRRGTLPKNMTGHPEVMAEIARLAELLPIGPDSKIEDVTASVGVDGERKYWKARHKTANFLKHADKDSDALLAEQDVDNANLLMQAAGAYLDLLHRQLLPEGLVLWLFVCARDDDGSAVPERFKPTFALLSNLGPEERHEFCSAMIGKLSEHASAA